MKMVNFLISLLIIGASIQDLLQTQKEFYSHIREHVIKSIKENGFAQAPSIELKEDQKEALTFKYSNEDPNPWKITIRASDLIDEGGAIGEGAHTYVIIDLSSGNLASVIKVKHGFGKNETINKFLGEVLNEFFIKVSQNNCPLETIITDISYLFKQVFAADHSGAYPISFEIEGEPKLSEDNKEKITAEIKIIPEEGIFDNIKLDLQKTKHELMIIITSKFFNYVFNYDIFTRRFLLLSLEKIFISLRDDVLKKIKALMEADSKLNLSLQEHTERLIEKFGYFKKHNDVYKLNEEEDSPEIKILNAGDSLTIEFNNSKKLVMSRRYPLRSLYWMFPLVSSFIEEIMKIVSESYPVGLENPENLTFYKDSFNPYFDNKEIRKDNDENTAFMEKLNIQKVDVQFNQAPKSLKINSYHVFTFSSIDVKFLSYKSERVDLFAGDEQAAIIHERRV